MTKNSYSQILDSTARHHLAENTDLAPQIMLRIQKGHGARMQTRMKITVMALLILLVLVIGLVNAPSVLAEVQRWFGYVPGIGLVRDGKMRVLAEQVSMTQDGITLTVEQVFVDPEKTTIVYSVDGLGKELLDSNQPGISGACYKNAVLRWLGKELSAIQLTGTSWGTGYKEEGSFAQIPADVDELTFVLPCIRSALLGKAPENWNLALNLIPAPPDMTAFPVIEISTPTAPAATATSHDTSALDPADISLTLDRAVQMDDGYLLYASLHSETETVIWMDIFDPASIHLVDAAGQEIPFRMLDPNELQEFGPGQPQQRVFAIKTAPIPAPGYLVLSLDSLGVTIPANASFVFDPGPKPEEGQSWDVNQSIDLGYGYSLQVMKANYPKMGMLHPSAGFSFEMESNTGVTSAALMDHAHQINGGGGGGGGSEPAPFKSGFSYAGGIPSGPITVSIESFTANLAGHWQVEWHAPDAPENQATPTLQPSACLTRKTWQQASKINEALPAGLKGKLARFEAPPPDYKYGVWVVNPDGSDQKLIGPGDAPSLSPDGKQVVYNGPMEAGPSNGLYISEIASGDTMLLPGTARGDSNPIWSRDGTQIAFTRGPSSGLIGAPGPYNIMVVEPDGSNLRALSSGSDSKFAKAWMPDGKSILYTMLEKDGVSVHTIDVQTGEIDALFETNYSGSMAISPDGKRMAFEEMLPLDKYGLFVSDLHGANRKLLADGDPYIVTVPSWSPDGQWIIASVQDPDANKQPNPTLVLIQVDTCQIISLPNLGGYVSSWLP